MNLFAKAFCRIYQFAFRVAQPVLPYREPEIMNSISEIAPLLRKKNVELVLLVTDSSLRGRGATAELEKNLAENGVKCAVYDGTRPNPTVQNVEEARKIYIREKCSCLIAFGGGSSMDCAKAVGVRIVKPRKSLAQLRGILHVRRRLPMIVAIPTTAGTGSEVTVTAVVTDSEKKHKYTISDFVLIPSHAVLDPEVTFTLPPSLTATTGMDALTHAVEAYIGGSTNRETRRLAQEATTLVFNNIEKAYSCGTDRTARENMLKAAYKAGVAFSKSYVGYIHAVAHSLGGQYNIPHGLANSVLMPIVLEEYGATIHKKLHELAIAAGVAGKEETHAEAAAKFIAAIRSLNAKMGIPEKLSGIAEADIPAMARHAAKEANPLYPVPQLMNATELERLYRLVSDGRAI